VRLELQVSEPPSKSGNICIVGDHEHLGEWDPENAFPIGLAASEGTFIAELSFPLSVQSIEYKVRLLPAYPRSAKLLNPTRTQQAFSSRIFSFRISSWLLTVKTLCGRTDPIEL